MIRSSGILTKGLGRALQEKNDFEAQPQSFQRTSELHEQSDEDDDEGDDEELQEQSDEDDDEDNKGSGEEYDTHVEKAEVGGE